MTRKEPFDVTSLESRKCFHKIDMFTYNMFRCSILLCVLGYSVNSVAFPGQQSYIPRIHFIYATHTHKSWDLVAEIVFCNSFWSRIHQCENIPGRSTIQTSSWVFIHFLVKLHKNPVASTNFDPTLMLTVFIILTSLYPKSSCCIYTLSSINQNKNTVSLKKKNTWNKVVPHKQLM